MSDELKRVLEFTHEELNSQENVGDYVKYKMRDALEEIDPYITDEMAAKGMDLRVTIEVLTRT